MSRKISERTRDPLPLPIRKDKISHRAEDKKNLTFPTGGIPEREPKWTCYSDIIELPILLFYFCFVVDMLLELRFKLLIHLPLFVLRMHPPPLTSPPICAPPADPSLIKFNVLLPVKRSYRSVHRSEVVRKNVERVSPSFFIRM